MKYEKQSTRNAKRKTQKIRTEKRRWENYMDAFKTALENEDMNRMINSDPRGGSRKGRRYTASKGGEIMPKAKPC
jgi:hypothetical protein